MFHGCAIGAKLSAILFFVDTKLRRIFQPVAFHKLSRCPLSHPGDDDQEGAVVAVIIAINNIKTLSYHTYL